MKNKEVRNLIQKLSKRAKQAKRECLYDSCTELAIDSHLLQKRGIINQISENQHVWELGIDNYKPDVFFFKRVGINDAFSFPGFCSEHDNRLFKEIENNTIDFNSYRTQLLFSYRAVMNEMRKKEILIDSFNRILNSNTLRKYLSEVYIKNLEKAIHGQRAGIKDELYYEKIFLSNIKDSNKRDFNFLTFELPKTEICSSSVFTYETSDEIKHMMKYDKQNVENPLTDIYFNFLPTDDKNIVIIGCLNERVELCWDYIKSFKTNSSRESLKKISDLLLCRVENWLCSNSFYNSKLKRNEKEIIKITQQSLKHGNERRELSFNLFQNE